MRPVQQEAMALISARPAGMLPAAPHSLQDQEERPAEPPRPPAAARGEFRHGLHRAEGPNIFPESPKPRPALKHGMKAPFLQEVTIRQRLYQRKI